MRSRTHNAYSIFLFGLARATSYRVVRVVERFPSLLIRYVTNYQERRRGKMGKTEHPLTKLVLTLQVNQLFPHQRTLPTIPTISTGTYSSTCLLSNYPYPPRCLVGSPKADHSW
ncbi:hypothetical protein GGR50DRAFT_535686 [Xylaria sp. CBS 124048]|nr:hypothetical protein GGR50DRAFT_535686 [Xylaria sp. CBS 124048]